MARQHAAAPARVSCQGLSNGQPLRPAAFTPSEAIAFSPAFEANQVRVGSAGSCIPYDCASAGFGSRGVTNDLPLKKDNRFTRANYEESLEITGLRAIWTMRPTENAERANPCAVAK